MSTRVPAPLPRGWPVHVKSAYLHAVSLARTALIDVCSGFENSPLVHARLAARLARFECDNARLSEEIRILRARVACIATRERPRYPPAERLAILRHRDAYGLSAAKSARTFLLSPRTIKDWTRRRDEQGDDALVRLPEPVNRFSDFVAAIVQGLKATLPSMGRKRIAQTLARAGLHLAPSTARRLLQRLVRPTPPEPSSETKPAAKKSEAQHPAPERRVTAKYPQHLWHVDLTVVPTACGLLLPWVSLATVFVSFTISPSLP